MTFWKEYYLVQGIVDWITGVDRTSYKWVCKLWRQLSINCVIRPTTSSLTKYVRCPAGRHSQSKTELSLVLTESCRPSQISELRMANSPHSLKTYCWVIDDDSWLHGHLSLNHLNGERCDFIANVAIPVCEWAWYCLLYMAAWNFVTGLLQTIQ